MAASKAADGSRYTYADLEAFPEDHFRREIIDGELFVTPSPNVRHQRTVTVLTARLFAYQQTNGGEVFPAPLDVYFADDSVVEPDVLFVCAQHADQLAVKFVSGAPDLVAEVSSPTTRRLELVRKRDLYQLYGVPEYWYVDLDIDRVEVYRLVEGVYGTPEMLGAGQKLEPTELPGFSISVKEVLGI